MCFDNRDSYIVVKFTQDPYFSLLFPLGEKLECFFYKQNSTERFYWGIVPFPWWTTRIFPICEAIIVTLSVVSLFLKIEMTTGRGISFSRIEE